MTNKKYERTTYKKDDLGRVIPTRLLSNPEELKFYLEGYDKKYAYAPDSYSQRQKNLYAYGEAVSNEVYEKNGSLVKLDDQNFISRSLRKKEKFNEVSDFAPKALDLTQIMERTNRNPAFIPSWAWRYD